MAISQLEIAMKEKALVRLEDPNVVPRRFRADDDPLKFLKTL
jgi:integrase/recombinase XerD